MNGKVLGSIFQRDFVSYFSSTTGYVFICVFVVLSALATFWPPEFFATNLANLDQLSRWLPFILLVFIPAITMSIWAEEKRQGTDELLLTSPASDLDVVLGKYLAGVAIFTVSLMFSAFSIFLVFKYGLGDPDPGLFLSTYVGYWFIGAAMIAIGMVASFLTDNLTVGFILGALFNLPLALFGVSGWFIKNPTIASFVRRWSALEQFRDFERGIVSLGGVTYFVMLAILMLYVSMVLIGKRHWQARGKADSLLGHYVLRTFALLLIAIGLTEFVQTNTLARKFTRADLSWEKINSLSKQTEDLIERLRDDEAAYTIKIEAFVSPQVPAEYSATKRDLLATLAELQALSEGKIRVTKNEIETYGAEATRAKETFGITPREVMVTEAGERVRDEFFLGVAFTSGPSKVVIPFLHPGLPVEYELVRSIGTVLNADRLRVGIVDTGIPGFLLPHSDRRLEGPLITELRKQYNVGNSPVDPTQPIVGSDRSNKNEYDVLLAIQPSMLDEQEMDNLIDAVKSGIPVAILEDPFPWGYPDMINPNDPTTPNLEFVAGTGEPKPFWLRDYIRWMRDNKEWEDNKKSGQVLVGPPPVLARPPETNFIDQLWKTLGVKLVRNDVVWHESRREASVSVQADEQWIFIDHGNGAKEPFSEEDPITSGLNQLLFLYAGSLKKDHDSKLDFEGLTVTGRERTGTVDSNRFFPGTNVKVMRRGTQNENIYDGKATSDSYIVAARVRGKYSSEDVDPRGNLLEGLIDDDSTELDPEEQPLVEVDEQEEADSGAEEQETNSGSAEAAVGEDEEVEINAVIVADIDWILPGFFFIRQSGDDEMLPATQNVTFILNIIDSLAGDERFLEIRKRVPQHRPLKKIDEETQVSRNAAFEARRELKAERTMKTVEAQTRYAAVMDEIENDKTLTSLERSNRKKVAEVRERRRLGAEVGTINAEQDQKLKQVNYDLRQEVRSVQDQYKLLALVIPPVAPLLVAFYMFFRRREAEREGVASSRLR